MANSAMNRGLYKRVLDLQKDGSPHCTFSSNSTIEMSPMSSLAHDLRSASMHTPCKRLSLNSTSSSISFNPSGKC